MAFIPTPDQFPTWQEWARHVVEVLSDSVDTGASSPTVSQPPPLKKILIANTGSYAANGRDANFLLGPFHYVMQTVRGGFTYTGNNAAMLLSSESPLVADTGDFAVTGQDATLTASATATLPIQGTAVPTFHSIGLYWQPVDESGAAVTPERNTVKMQYKTIGGDFRPGHDMWYDDRQAAGRPKEARGSIVYCLPNTPYIIQFGLPHYDANGVLQSTKWIAEIHTQTWSEDFDSQIGTRSTDVWTGENRTFKNSSFPAGNGSRRAILIMDRSGTPGNYTIYDFTGLNAVANAQNDSHDNAVKDYCVIISANYVILRGLKCVGGGDASIFIDPGHHDIVIEDCDISEWSTKDTGQSYTLLYKGTTTTSDSTVYNGGATEQSGISLQPHPKYGSALTSRVIVQNCKIHNPKYGNKPWDYGHPSSTCGVLIYDTGGNHVFRYNEFYSTELDGSGNDSGYTGTPKWNCFMQDSIMGGDNFSNVGSPGSDSDVYKNIFMHNMDDGVEFEGGNMNARGWGNYIDYTATGLATTPCVLGPVYLFRNVYNRCRKLYNQIWGEESDRLGMFKAGDGTPDGGRRYLYHNTCLQYPNDNGHAPLGIAYGISGVGSGISNTVTRNNIFEVWKTGYSAIDRAPPGTGNDFDYDMTNGSMGSSEPNGKEGVSAAYQTDNGPLATWTGKYRLQAGKPGYSDGVLIDNFNNNVDAPFQYNGTAPDRGAHEDGNLDMVFGTAASGTGP